ncbi:MAG: efflux RND transporter permease subunit [Pseudomonadota bacterium]
MDLIRRLAAPLIAAAVIVAGLGLIKAEIAADTYVFFSDKDPYIQNKDEFEKRFGAMDSIVIAMHSAEPVWRGDGLSRLHQLTEAAWKLPNVRRVDSAVNQPILHGAEDELSVFEIGDDPSEIEAAFGKPVAEIIANEPNIVGRLVSADGRTAIAHASFHLDKDDKQASARIYAAARALKRDFERAHDVEIHITGDVPIMVSYRDATIRSAVFVAPVALALVFCFLGVMLGRWTAFVPVAAIVGAATVVACGYASWRGYQFNPVTGISPIVILAITTANAAHLLHFHRVSFLETGSAAAAWRFVEAEILGPVLIANIFTFVGFASMLAASSPPIRQFGEMILVALPVISLGHLSIVRAWCLRASWRESEAVGGQILKLASEGAVSLLSLRKTITLVAASVVLAVMMTGVVNLRLNESWLNFVDRSFPSRAGSDFVQSRGIPVVLVDYTISAAPGSSAIDPTYLENLKALTAWIEDQPNVSFTLDIADVVRRINAAMENNNDRLDDAPLPTSEDSAAQFLLLYELNLPPGFLLSDQLSTDYSASRLTVAFQTPYSAQLRDFDEAFRRWLSQNGDGLYADLGAGANFIGVWLSQSLFREMAGGIAVSLVIISLLMAILLRDARLSLLAFLANALPIALVFGVWGWFIGDFSIAASVVIAVTLGIVVDDTVVLISRYNKLRREDGADPRAALAATIRDVGSSMTASSIALTIGFIALTASGFQVTKELGLGSAAIVVLALAFDLIVLPNLILLRDRRSRAPASAAP